jgi:hypothetical protein
MSDDVLRRRFWSKVDVNNDDPNACWPWLPKTKSTLFRPKGRSSSPVQAHRVAYELEVGELPKGAHVKHTCGNRRCCNPGHLTSTTRARSGNRGGRTAFKSWEREQIRQEHAGGASVQELRTRYNAQVLTLLKILFGKK